MAGRTNDLEESRDPGRRRTDVGVTLTRPEARFRAREHIRRREDFQRIYDRGVKRHGRLGTFFVLRTDLDIGRLGIAASRKFGKAVARNRAKRLIREAFRLNKIGAGVDVVVVPKRALLDVPLSDFVAEFRRLLRPPS